MASHIIALAQLRRVDSWTEGAKIYELDLSIAMDLSGDVSDSNGGDHRMDLGGGECQTSRACHRGLTATHRLRRPSLLRSIACRGNGRRKVRVGACQLRPLLTRPGKNRCA